VSDAQRVAQETNVDLYWLQMEVKNLTDQEKTALETARLVCIRIADGYVT
jgi:hypothetical protein